MLSWSSIGVIIWNLRVVSRKSSIPVINSRQRLWRVVVTDCWWSYGILQPARLLLAKDVMYIATDHIMVNEHLLLLWQLDWLLCPPPSRSCFVLQVNVFVPAVLKSEDVKDTELKVKCMGASYNLSQNCLSRAYIAIKGMHSSLANKILFLQTHISGIADIWLQDDSFTS